MGFFSKIFKSVRKIVDPIVNVVDDAIDWVGGLLKPEVPGTDPADSAASGLTVNKSSSSANIPVIYGRRKVGGTRVFLNTTGPKNKYLNSVLVQCVGPVHSSSSVTVSDKAESEYGALLRHTFHHGYPSQAADANLVSELSEWTSNHRLQGLAYEAVQYTYDQDKYSGLPVFKSIIEGALLYDPRTGSTGYSDNFALVVLDYFRSAEYGVGMSDTLIDFESFKTSATLADVSYPSNSNSSIMVKRFSCNAAIDTSKTPFDNIKQLVSESRAFLTQTAGVWRYVIQNDANPNHTITYDDIIGDISKSPNGARDKYNRVTITYVDPDKQWETNEATYPINDAEYQGYLAEDNWEESHADITVESCTNRYQALDIARQALLESRKGGVISFNGQPWTIKVRCGDLLVMDMPGLNDGILWRVATRTLDADGSVSFACAMYDPSIFPWIDIPDQQVVTKPTIADASVLPPPETLSYLSNNWNEGTVGALTWPQSNSAFVHDYLIEIYRASDSIQVLTTTLSSSNDWADDYIPILNLPYLAAGNYYATVRARNALTRSSATTATFSVNVPVVDRVTGLAVVGEFDSSLTLKWSALVSPALRHYQVEIYNVQSGHALASINTVTETTTISFELFKSMGFPRSFEVRVSGVNVAGVVGESAALAVSKPAPIAPAIQAWASVNDIKLTLSAPSNAKGAVVWLANVAPVPKNDANQRYKGESLSITLDGLAALTEYKIAIASYDAFGLGESSAHTVTTLNDAVSDAINQLKERDLSLSDDIEQVAKAAAERVQKQQFETDDVAEQLFKSAARAAEMQRYQLSQNDEYYRILNAVVEIDPSNGTIINRAYQYTNDRFSEAKLLIDGVDASIALQASRIDTTNDRLTDAESELSVQAGLINQRATFTQLTETVAGAIAAIQPAYVTTFNTGLDGWVAQSGTAVYNAGAWVDLTLGDIAATMDYSGADNHVIQLSIARESGAVWAGKVQYKTASHDYSSDYEMDIPEILDDGQLYTVTVDFGDVEDYTASNITGLRIILGETTDDMYQLHSLQAGKRTAAQAAIEGLQGRVSSAEQNIDAVSGQLSNYVTTTFYEQNTLTQNDVQQTLDSWNAQYSVIAKLTELDENGTVTKANSAEQWIDGAEALISQIAQSTTQQEYGARVSAVEQTLDAQAGSISQQIVSTHQSQVDNDDLSENAFLEAANAAASEREQLKQNDTIALARSETKAVANETTALAQTVDELEVVVDENKAEFSDYRRAAIGYCVDSSGNPTSHETAASCELAGNTWRGNSSIAEALRNVKVTGTNADGETVEISAGNMYQTILEADGRGAATAALLAVYGDQLAGVFANAGVDGSSLEFIANQMKFKTQNGTKTPFRIEGDQVYANELIVDGASIKDATITSEKVVNSAITNAQIANAAITSAKIANGQITNAHIANAAITSAKIGDGQITNAHIANAAITSAKIGDGQITNAKIGDVIQSANYSPGVSGWRILKNGSAEFNGVVVSREMTVASGTFSLGRVQGGDGTIKYDAILDTGYPANAWSGSKFYTGVAVGFVNTGVQSNTPSTSAWGVSAEVIPLTRFYSQATINLRIRVYGAYNVTLDPCNISWRLLRVT
ncbi:hypothetical protein MSP8886_01448 [Marinomonas spartinae]|uniref:Tip attachment protein J central straight fiber domain-containing protein n=1 Tax=Marinomonas spartinae TaxID=1792290 RepID=A0A1A8TAN5_9GAMM|nr:phage tail protein [Marinomonas spartinae]SBS29124.1 hypothetical protein MSP8886_01448 [Marinomonas spartinae]